MEYVFSANDGMVSWGPVGSTVTMVPNDIWFADDPFVLARPELFSATPLRAHSTQGREAPVPTPLTILRDPIERELSARKARRA